MIGKSSAIPKTSFHDPAFLTVYTHHIIQVKIHLYSGNINVLFSFYSRVVGMNKH